MRQKPTWYELSAKITPDLVTFPGDPGFSSDKICSIEKGEKFNLRHMHFGNHAGTHIDFPLHTIPQGKSSSDFPLEYLIGSGLVIEVPCSEKSVSLDFVSMQPILANDIVFFKTANSEKSKHESFTDNYVYIEPDAADDLIIKKVKIAGIDYLSVDRFDDENLSVHNALLSKEILIVEGLELSRIPEGRYEIFIIPLNIPDMDGLPARVFATCPDQSKLTKMALS